MWLGLLVIALGVVCALLYGRWRKRMAGGNWVTWWDTFTSIIVAAIISFGAAVALYNTQQEAERNDQREALKKSLGMAITYIRANHAVERVPHTVTLQGKKADITIMPKMPTVAFEEAIRSGLFTDSLGRAVYPIAAQLDLFNTAVDDLAGLPANEDADWSDVRRRGDFIDEMRKLVLDNCDILVRDLNLAVDSSLFR